MAWDYPTHYHTHYRCSNLHCNRFAINEHGRHIVWPDSVCVIRSRVPVVCVYLFVTSRSSHTPSVVVPHIQNSFNPHTSQNEGVAVGMYRIGWNIIHLNCVRSRNISAGMCSHVFFARPRAERKRTPVRPAGLATSLLFPRYTHTHTHRPLWLVNFRNRLPRCCQRNASCKIIANKIGLRIALPCPGIALGFSSTCFFQTQTQYANPVSAEAER